MLSHTELKQQALAKPAVKAAYDALAEEYALARELLHAREMAGLAQAEMEAAFQIAGGKKSAPS